MVKKLSLLGATALILFEAFQKDINNSSSYGTLLEQSKQMGTGQSLALLVARLLLCALFIWAGEWQERHVGDN